MILGPCSHYFAIFDLLKLLQNFPKAPKPSQLGEVRMVASGFEANIHRLEGLLLTWPYVSQLTMISSIAACLSAFDSTKNAGRLIDL
jgi:hypothetical protein